MTGVNWLRWIIFKMRRHVWKYLFWHLLCLTSRVLKENSLLLWIIFIIKLGIASARLKLFLTVPFVFNRKYWRLIFLWQVTCGIVSIGCVLVPSSPIYRTLRTQCEFISYQLNRVQRCDWSKLQCGPSQCRDDHTKPSVCLCIFTSTLHRCSYPCTYSFQTYLKERLVDIHWIFFQWIIPRLEIYLFYQRNLKVGNQFVDS